MKLIILILILISIADGQFLSGLLSAFSGFPFVSPSAGLSSATSGSVSQRKGLPINPFSPYFGRDLQDFMMRTIIDTQKTVQEASKYYNPSETDKPTFRPLRPAFKYPSIKNSLNTAESNLKTIESPYGGGLTIPN